MTSNRSRSRRPASTITPAAAAATPASPVERAHFELRYQSLLRHLELKGLQTKTIEAYSRGIRRMGEYFCHRIDALTNDQLVAYFSDLRRTHSWSSVKLDLYGYKFFTVYVLEQAWVMPTLVKAPKVQRLPDIVTAEEAQALFRATRCLSYRVFFFTLYSMGLRLGEGLALRLGDIDAQSMRVHIRDGKGNRDRMVPLPQASLHVLRRFWAVHRHPELIFPARTGGAEAAGQAQRPLDRAGVQRALAQVCADIGLKKTFTPTAFATALAHTRWRPASRCPNSSRFWATTAS